MRDRGLGRARVIGLVIGTDQPEASKVNPSIQLSTETSTCYSDSQHTRSSSPNLCRMSQQKDGSILSFFKPAGASTPARPQSSASNSAKKLIQTPKSTSTPTNKTSGLFQSSSPAPRNGSNTPLTARASTLTSEADLMTLDEEPSSPEPVVSSNSLIYHLGGPGTGLGPVRLGELGRLSFTDLTRRRAPKSRLTQSLSGPGSPSWYHRSEWSILNQTRMMRW